MRRRSAISINPMADAITTRPARYSAGAGAGRRHHQQQGDRDRADDTGELVLAPAASATGCATSCC